jgi:hypothetical protein
MKNHSNTARFWSTASFGGNTDTSPMELLSLGDHLGLCNGAQRHFFALRCLTESARDFVATRFVTTLVCVALVIGVVALAL